MLAVHAKNAPAKSTFLFQACDQRHLLGRKFVLFQDGNAFRRLDERGLTISDSLSTIIINGELLFKSFFQAKKFLPLDHLYREATTKQVEELLGHSKLILPPGFDMAVTLDAFTSITRKKVAAILDANTLQDAAVTPDKIKAYAKKYRKLDLTIRTKGGTRQIEVPSAPADVITLIRCLDEVFYTSELTDKQFETNSFRPNEVDGNP